jgi:biotin transport system substrate-specific component
MTNVLSLRSSTTALVDRLREENASLLLQATGVLGFAVLTALSAQIQFRVYLWEVPITLQTAAVYASGLYLGWRSGFLAQLLYLVLGLFLPVFAGDGYGAGYLFGAVSAGYLLSYPLAAAVIGALSKRWKTFSGSTLAMLLGSALVFTVGVVWLHYAAGHATWVESIDKGFLRFVVIDVVKVLAVGGLYSGTRRLFASNGKGTR